MCGSNTAEPRQAPPAPSSLGGRRRPESLPPVTGPSDPATARLDQESQTGERDTPSTTRERPCTATLHPGGGARRPYGLLDRHRPGSVSTSSSRRVGARFCRTGRGASGALPHRRRCGCAERSSRGGSAGEPGSRWSPSDPPSWARPSTQTTVSRAGKRLGRPGLTRRAGSKVRGPEPGR